MPIYVHECENGHRFERVLRFSQLDERQLCDCGSVGSRVICKPLMVSVQQDVCYSSPIDGRAITNKQMREDDLRRNNCIEYDPGMKQDAARRRAEMDVALDKSVDETVERQFAAMPTRKLEKLTAELQSGAVAEIARQSPERSA